ncbi:MAG: DUF255 domain-containing protein [Chromatiales bacterium]|nr:thioredoxin domain-containing protein [Gammaproteobacteria bacterium]MBW6475986.1 DUF255 domain-containing protein [Chromatiales bacterium]
MPHVILLLVLLFPLNVLADSPLRDHPSPYLAMHANDPVAWQLWGQDAFAQAQRENKLIFVSSGYYACQWCHVMQRESYQNNAIAAQFNQDYISIKIDRELRPDLDAYLFDFVQKTHGVAGWPLNAFLTPEGLPLLGFVYMPPEAFSTVIRELQQGWQRDPAHLTALAREAARPDDIAPSPSDQAGRTALREDFTLAFTSALQQQGDFLSGGLGNSSKFPQPTLISVVLEHFADHPDLGEWLRITLAQMQALGLRDHLGGGFFRYTVDPEWHEPHFEKMLYDNAQLAHLYLRAAELLGKPHFRQVGEQAIDNLLRQMWHHQGGLVGSLSAVDGSDVEGGYYLWDTATLARLLTPQQLAIIELSWGTAANPIWDNGYLPMALLDGNTLADRLGHSTETLEGEQQAIRQVLMRERRQREMPYDDKRLAGWNGLALSAISLASTQQPRYQIAARTLRNYLHSLWDGEQLWMMRDNQGQLQQAASLEDYALVAIGLYDWYQTSDDQHSRELAATLLQQAAQHFYRDGLWQLNASDDTGLLGQRYALLGSGTLPSPAVQLLRLQRKLGLNVLPEEQLLWANPPALLADPLGHAEYLALMLEISQ